MQVVLMTNMNSAGGFTCVRPGAKAIGKRMTKAEHRSGWRRQSCIAEGVAAEPLSTATRPSFNSSRRQACASGNALTCCGRRSSWIRSSRKPESRPYARLSWVRHSVQQATERASAPPPGR